jgi:serine/threonine protein kinase
MLIFCSSCEKHVESAVNGASGKVACLGCGAEMNIPSVNQLQKGTGINGFMIEDKLGQGGMGVVYKAKQLTLERHVALKLLSDELARDADFVERFFKEARSAASLSHPNIVQVYDAGATPEGIYYFAMELIEGETLDTKISRDGLLPQKDALEIAIKIASALDYAWEKQSLCHGDIKPDNIIIARGGDAKLADLGLAKSVHDENDFKEGVMATPLYAPPEVISGDTDGIDCHSDMYSFGATLYHIFSGMPPFPGDDPETVMKKHLDDKPIPLSEVNGELNLAISDLVDRLLSKNPESRPASWKEICRSLAGIHIKSSPSSARRAESKSRLKTAAYLVAAVISVASAVAAYIYIYDWNRRDATVKRIASFSTSAIAEKPRNEWLKVKNGIAQTDPETGIGLIQEYVKNYPSYIPQDAEILLQTLRQKQFSIQKKIEDVKKRTDAIRKDVADLVGLATVSDFKSMKKWELEEFSRKIKQILAIVSENTEVLIPPESRNELARASIEISDTLLNMKAEAERKVLEEQAEKKREHIEQVKKKIAENEKRRQDKLLADSILDGYYLLLINIMSSYSTEKDTEHLKKLVEAWFGKNEKNTFSEPLEAKCNFLLDTVIPGEPLIFSVFEKNEAALRGKNIPGSIVSLKISSEYLVEKISDKSIRLKKTTDKVKTGRIITQGQLTPEIISQLLQHRILSPDSGIHPSSQEMCIILTFYLLNGMRTEFSEYLKTCNVLSGQEKKNWESIAEDIKVALDNENAIGLWREFCRLDKERRNKEALQLLAELRNSCKNTDFYKRYSDEIVRQSARLGAYTQ